MRYQDVVTHTASIAQISVGGVFFIKLFLMTIMAPPIKKGRRKNKAICCSR